MNLISGLNLIIYDLLDFVYTIFYGLTRAVIAPLSLVGFLLLVRDVLSQIGSATWLHAELWLLLIYFFIINYLKMPE